MKNKTALFTVSSWLIIGPIIGYALFNIFAGTILLLFRDAEGLGRYAYSITLIGGAIILFLAGIEFLLYKLTKRRSKIAAALTIIIAIILLFWIVILSIDTNWIAIISLIPVLQTIGVVMVFENDTKGTSKDINSIRKTVV